MKQPCGIARILYSTPGTPSSKAAAQEGARDTRGPGALKFTRSAQTGMLGPADLDVSRHRGLSKSVNCRKSAVSPASRARCLRLAPRRPRWADHFYPPLVTPCRGAGLSRLGPPGRFVAFPAKRHSRPPLPAPHLKMLYRHPSLGRDRNIVSYIRNKVKPDAGVVSTVSLASSRRS
jgi:hypothetical protein